MLMAIIGDYLLGFGTFGMTTSPGGQLEITANAVPDWRYAASSMLGFLCVPLFAAAAMELLKVMQKRYGLEASKFFRLFRLANWSGVLYFAFIHIGICMLPVVFNAGLDATGDQQAAVGMMLRVAGSIAAPLALGFIACDVLAAVGWIGMVVKGALPLKKAALICNPVIVALLGQLMNLIVEGMDSGFESLGWLLMYLVCAFGLVDRGERGA